MLFNSFEFLVFFPIVVCLYFLLPYRWRWLFLLVASYYFYACWKLEYIFLIIASTFVDYWVGLKMGSKETLQERRPYLILSLCFNLGILFAFKYFNFFNDSLQAVFDRFNLFYGVPAFNTLLPVGISFYTFQTLSYSIDVYRGEKKPEQNLGVFALYVAFFPQLVAGPIERSTHLLPQFHQQHRFDEERVSNGLKQMLWGFFKKLVIADRLAIYVNEVYNNPSTYHGFPLLLATYFFAYQIYCDFSGYSDIAIGAARVLGYDLMENFRQPYFSKSVSEFWRRWHISLSTWFRDYLYIPLGGNRVGRWQVYRNLMIVFLASGLWHGAAWTFVIWGGIHGAYLVLERMSDRIRNQIWNWLEQRTSYFLFFRHWVAVFCTFNLVVFAWIFFRANSLADAMLIIQNLFNFSEGGRQITLSNFGAVELLIAFSSIIFLELIHLLEQTKPLSKRLSEQPLGLRWGFYYALLFSILLFGIFTEQEFIYFQF